MQLTVHKTNDPFPSCFEHKRFSEAEYVFLMKTQLLAQGSEKFQF